MKQGIQKIKDVPLFQGLSAEALRTVQGCLIEKSYRKGEIIHSEGSGCGRVFIIESGSVKIYRLSSTGREQILETLGPGETCACNPGSLNWFCGSTAQALSASKIWFLSREDYVRMVHSNLRLAQTLNHLFAERLQDFGNLIEEVSLKDAKKRLVKFILDMASRKPPQGLAAAKPEREILFLPLTREEIAQRIGTSRETVARYLSQLRRSRLIELKPHQIIVLSRPGLQKLLHGVCSR